MKILLISFFLFFTFKQSYCQQKSPVTDTTNKEWLYKNCPVLVYIPGELIADTAATSILPKIGLIPEKIMDRLYSVLSYSVKYPCADSLSNPRAGPLVIVDSLPFKENIDKINPDDIESITVLTGPSAAMYGAKGYNGVVIIVRKKKEKPVSSE